MVAIATEAVSTTKSVAVCKPKTREFNAMAWYLTRARCRQQRQKKPALRYAIETITVCSVVS